MQRKIEYKFTEYLDDARQNLLFVRFVFFEDNGQIEEFVVSQLVNIGGRTEEIIRFDCSAKEPTNVHRFYLNPPKKFYLNEGLGYGALEIFKSNIRNNWHVYRSKYMENYNR